MGQRPHGELGEFLRVLIPALLVLLVISGVQRARIREEVLVAYFDGESNLHKALASKGAYKCQ